jgi:hypothetical protein
MLVAQSCTLRRGAGERHVRSVLVVVAAVLTYQTQQMPFTQHDHVVEQLTAERPDESLRVPVHPRRPRRDAHGREPQPLDPLVEGATVDAISVADQP